MAAHGVPQPNSAGARSQLIRLVVAAVVVGAGLLILWQAGVLFKDEGAVETPSVSLDTPDVSVTTPPVGSTNVGLKEGDVAPDFVFSSLDGQRVRLSDLRGKPVLLNFWASWCIPCRAEMPEMQEALGRYQAQNLVIVGMNRGESYGIATRFIDKIGVKLSMFGYDPNEQVSKKYGIQGLPTSYFIDARGVIVRAVLGPLTKNILENGIQAALKQPVP